jgi:hypothetical protein
MREFATWYLVVLTVAMASGPLIGFFRARARLVAPQTRTPSCCFTTTLSQPRC